MGKNTVIIMVTIIVLTVIYFVFKQKIQGMFSSGKDNQDPLNISPKTAQTVFQMAKWPLKWGSEGPIIEMLQQHLNEQNVAPLKPLVVDGVFGDNTLVMLKAVAGKKELSKQEFAELSPFILIS